VMNHGIRPMNYDDVINAVNDGAIIIDTRDKQIFNKEFIPGSINIGLDGSFAVWVGTIITNIDQAIILLTVKGVEEEAVMRLARVGYDNSIGFIEDGINTWKDAGGATDSIDSISVAELKDRLNKDNITLLDVRKPTEYEAEHVENAVSFPLDYINQSIGELDKNKTYYLHCKSGYRSMAAASILRSKGFNNLIDVDGGFDEIAKSDIPKTDFACASENS